MDTFYRAFLGPGDLAFDIGSHVGDRVGSFRRIGARVLAVEPQPALERTLRWLYGRDTGVQIEAAAVGQTIGLTDLRLNINNPTVSTVSKRFISAAQDAPGWEGQRWDATLRVAQITLDDLIDRYGTPRFVKIDVEGYEPEVLAGLSRPLDALSFEFTTIQKEAARRALRECGKFQYRHFNAVLGEEYAFVHDSWLDDAAIGDWLDALPQAANSGDIYGVRADHPVLKLDSRIHSA
jgi:FkbM family methyltransferase